MLAYGNERRIKKFPEQRLNRVHTRGYVPSLKSTELLAQINIAT